MWQLNLGARIECNFQSSHHLLWNEEELLRQLHQNTQCLQLGLDFQPTSDGDFQLDAFAFEKFYFGITRGNLSSLEDLIFISREIAAQVFLWTLRNEALKEVLGKLGCKAFPMVWVQQVWDKALNLQEP